MKVFVYGTLKRGYGNNRLLTRDGVIFVGEATTEDTFDMMNSGFPVLVFNEDFGLPVKGEVYDIGDNTDILRSLDALEGEGVMYDRTEITVVPVQQELGDQMNVSVYVGNPSYWARGIRTSNPVTDPRYVRDGYLEWSR